jgi:hypothetical protein
MQQKIQKKPQATGTNEEEHADEEQQQFDPEAEFFVDLVMAQPSEDGTGNLPERIL